MIKHTLGIAILPPQAAGGNAISPIVLHMR